MHICNSSSCSSSYKLKTIESDPDNIPVLRKLYLLDNFVFYKKPHLALIFTVV